MLKVDASEMLTSVEQTQVVAKKGLSQTKDTVSQVVRTNDELESIVGVTSNITEMNL